MPIRTMLIDLPDREGCQRNLEKWFLEVLRTS